MDATIAREQQPTHLFRRDVAAFCLLTFTLSWLSWFPLIAARFGWLPKASAYWHLVGSLGPAAAAMLMASASSNVRQVLSRAWRAHPPAVAWFIALTLPILLVLVGSLTQWATTGAFPDVAAIIHNVEYTSLRPASVLAIQLLFYGFGEEIGWRGYLMPALAQRLGAWSAGLLIAVPWTLWHLPLLVAAPGFSTMSPLLLTGWAFSMLCGSLLMAWLWQLARGAILPLAIFHGLLDLAMSNDGLGNAAQAGMGAVISIAGLWACRDLVAASREPRSVAGQ